MDDDLALALAKADFWRRRAGMWRDAWSELRVAIGHRTGSLLEPRDHASVVWDAFSRALGGVDDGNAEAAIRTLQDAARILEEGYEE